MSNPQPSVVTSIKQALSQSNFAQALQLIESGFATIEDDATFNELLYMQAVAYRLAKQPQRALESLNTLIERRPDYGRAYQEQGYCYQQLGNNKLSANAFYQATRFNQALLPSWKQLLAVYQSTNNTEAIPLAERHIAYLSSLPKPVLGAYDLMYEGQLHKAEAVCRQFLQQHRHDPEAMMLLAELGIQLKVYHDAEFLLESCVALYPDNERAAAAYQALLLKLGKFPQAVTLARKRLAVSPDNTTAQIALANALVGVGEIEAGISQYHALLERTERLPGVWLSLGHALKAKGDLQQAITAYRKAASVVHDLGDAYWSLANTKTYTFSADDISAMQELEGQKTTALEDRIHLCFALGKAYEDKRHYKQSFYYYQRGNELKKRTLGFDIAKVEHAMLAQQKACPASVFSEVKGGCQAPDPIFIVGLPRAGSTLLEQILASHSMVDGTMELHDILGIASKISNQKTAYPFNLAELDDKTCTQLGELYIEQTQSYRQGAPFFIDKMPNNFIHVGLIKRILPNAKIIDARREPFACCFSGFKQLFGEGQEFSYALSDIGRYYVAYEKLMAHWHSVLPGQILTVQHEDVLEDLEGQVRRLLAFCDLPFEQSCLEYHKTDRVIKTPSSEQVRQPIFKTSVHQWKHYQSHLTPLFDALARYPEQ